MKKPPILLLILFLVSCASPTLPAEEYTTYTPIHKTPNPTTYSTAVYTPIPTIEVSPSIEPTGTQIDGNNVQNKSELEINNVLLSAQTDEGKGFAVRAPGSFLVLSDPKEGSQIIQLLLQLQHLRKDEYTTAEISALTNGWQVNLYKYRYDGNYHNQPALIIDNLQAKIDGDFYSLMADFLPDDLHDQLGDNRAFSFQVFDEKDTLKWQGAFALNPYGSIPINWGSFVEVAADGIVHGYPHSRLENEVAFVKEDQYITIQEPQGGFYLLFYFFDLTRLTDFSGTLDLAAQADEYAIELFPYREEGRYESEKSEKLNGEYQVISGIYYVYFPVEIVFDDEKYDLPQYLRISDGDGKVIKEETFLFIPHDK